MDPLTEQDVAKAERRMNERLKTGPYAVEAHYDRRVSRIIIMLNSGVELAIPPRLAEGLSDARPDQLDNIEVSPSGLGLYFPELDADLYVPALLEGVLGSRSWMARQLGTKGGSSMSAAKAKAARENGKKGGRPRSVSTQVLEMDKAVSTPKKITSRSDRSVARTDSGKIAVGAAGKKTMKKSPEDNAKVS